MANKTLSIKMDEKDIEKLKRYHEALIKAGITSEKDVTFNALCKHLLLDYLSEDIKDAASAYNSCGFRIVDSESNLPNVYDLSQESFSIMQKCYETSEKEWKKDLEEAIGTFEELGNLEIYHDENVISRLYVLPEEETEGQDVSFWVYKWMDRQSNADDRFTRKELDGIVEFIENSSVTDDEKKKLIDEMREKHEQRRLAFMRTQRMGKK